MEIGEKVAVSLPDEPESKMLEVRFERDEVRCGDEVRLSANAENIANGESVTFSLKQNGAAVETLKATVVAAYAESPWISKCSTDDHPEPPFSLSGAADGQSAEAESGLTLEKYEDIARQTKILACQSGQFRWTGKFDVSLISGELRIVTRIKLLNRTGEKPPLATTKLPAIGSPVIAAHKAFLKANIEGKLSNKNFFHRARCRREGGCNCPKTRGCCKIRVRIEVEFVESGEHHTVNLFQGAGRANATNWTRVPTRDNSYAHETGHLLGWYDEYAEGAVGASPRWTVQKLVVMNTGLTVPPEYYWDFRDWLTGTTAESWTAITV